MEDQSITINPGIYVACLIGTAFSLLVVGIICLPLIAFMALLEKLMHVIKKGLSFSLALPHTHPSLIIARKATPTPGPWTLVVAIAALLAWLVVSLLV